MKNQFNLNIKTPCSENFNQFSPTPDGGFCGSCEKEVIDFTKMNRQEIVSFFKNKETQNTCGRFNSNQLKTYNEKHQKNKKFSFFGGIGLACLALFSFGTAQAQDTKKGTKATANLSEIKASKFEKNILVKGNVSNETAPLPGVNIILEGTNIGTTTNFDGDFEFPQKLKKGDVLVFSYIGLESQKVVIDNENSTSKIELKINMNMDSCILMGKIAVKKVYKSKRN